MRKGLLVLAMAALLAGCAGTPREQNTVAGAALGAGTGALLGGLVGGSTGAAVAGGIVGGTVGGIAGANAGAPPPEPETCYVRTRSGRMRPVPCDEGY